MSEVKKERRERRKVTIVSISALICFSTINALAPAPQQVFACVHQTPFNTVLTTSFSDHNNR